MESITDKMRERVRQGYGVSGTKTETGIEKWRRQRDIRREENKRERKVVDGKGRCVLCTWNGTAARHG